MAGSAAHLVDRVLPSVPLRQYVLAFPYELSGLAATRPEVLAALLANLLGVAAHALPKMGEGRGPRGVGARGDRRRHGRASLLASPLAACSGADFARAA